MVRWVLDAIPKIQAWHGNLATNKKSPLPEKSSQNHPWNISHLCSTKKHYNKIQDFFYPILLCCFVSFWVGLIVLAFFHSTQVTIVKDRLEKTDEVRSTRTDSYSNGVVCRAPMNGLNSMDFTGVLARVSGVISPYFQLAFWAHFCGIFVKVVDGNYFPPKTKNSRWKDGFIWKTILSFWNGAFFRECSNVCCGVYSEKEMSPGQRPYRPTYVSNVVNVRKTNSKYGRENLGWWIIIMLLNGRTAPVDR